MTAGRLFKKPPRFPEMAAVFLFALTILLFFADTNGYEGDDLNAIIPMLNLPEFLRQPETIYKYDWQPLAYWTGYAAYQFTGSIVAVFLLPPFAMATAITLLYAIVTGFLGVGRLLFVPILMMFPEIVYTGLYFNSTALGYPFAVLAVLLAFCGPGWGKAALTGICLGVAVAMRLDFALVVPAILLLRLFITGAVWDSVCAGIVVLLFLGVSIGIGLLDPHRVLEIYQVGRAEIVAKAQDGGWNAETKLRVATVIFSPLGWAFLLIATGFVIRTGSRQLRWQVLAILLSLAPFLYSLQNLLSVKYMVPVFALLPVFAAMVWVEMTKRLSAATRRGTEALWVSLTVILILVSVEPQRIAPYIRVTATDPRVIGTHDGQRSWGAYLAWFFRVERDQPDHEQSRRAARADRFVDLVETEAEIEIWLVGDRNYFDPGGMGWKLIYVRLERAGYRGDLDADGAVRFEVPLGRIVLATPDIDVPAGSCVILLDEVTDPEAFVQENCLD